jgi:hypothetical protein
VASNRRKIREIAGKFGMETGLEFEGKDEGRSDKVQEKIGKIKKVFEE